MGCFRAIVENASSENAHEEVYERWGTKSAPSKPLFFWGLQRLGLAWSA